MKSAIFGALILTGLFAGLLSGFSYKSGVGADSDSIVLSFLDFVCDDVKDNVTKSTCFFSLSSLTLLVYVASIIEVIWSVALTGRPIVGGLIWVVTWFTGFLVALI
ncbi:MAG: hypothetical protein GOU98_04560 [Candidatus Altiarchaeota archaeon]|nr:hypothetical protein [Candidatus Altiarchaeota archaeon]